MISKTTKQPSRLLDIPDVTEELQISILEVRKLISEGRLKASVIETKSGSKFRITEANFDAFVNAGLHRINLPIDEETNWFPRYGEINTRVRIEFARMASESTTDRQILAAMKRRRRTEKIIRIEISEADQGMRSLLQNPLQRGMAGSIRIAGAEPASRSVAELYIRDRVARESREIAKSDRANILEPPLLKVYRTSDSLKRYRDESISAVQGHILRSRETRAVVINREELENGDQRDVQEIKESVQITYTMPLNRLISNTEIRRIAHLVFAGG